MKGKLGLKIASIVITTVGMAVQIVSNILAGKQQDATITEKVTEEVAKAMNKES